MLFLVNSYRPPTNNQSSLQLRIVSFQYDVSPSLTWGRKTTIFSVLYLLQCADVEGASTQSTAVVGGPSSHYYGKPFIFQPNFIAACWISRRRYSRRFVFAYMTGFRRGVWYKSRSAGIHSSQHTAMSTRTGECNTPLLYTKEYRSVYCKRTTPHTRCLTHREVVKKRYA